MRLATPREISAIDDAYEAGLRGETPPWMSRNYCGHDGRPVGLGEHQPPDPILGAAYAAGQRKRQADCEARRKTQKEAGK